MMNMLSSMHRRVSSVFLIALAALVFWSCDGLSDFGDMNRDPTAVSDLDPDFEFSTVQLGTAGSRWEVWRANLIYNELIVQHLHTQIGAGFGGTYGLSDGYTAAFFEAAYDGGVNQVGWLAAVKNVENLIHNLEGDPDQANRLAAARIWRALIYQRLTDTYGDLPYFEAGQGYISGEFAPRYTPQDSIYYDMHDELQAALDQFDASKPTYGSADLVYGGDINQWKKFANSLQLRLALRLVKVDPDRARQWAEEAINSEAGVMTGNDDIAYMAHESGPSSGPAGFNTNANSEVYDFGVPRISQALADYMKERNDPRLLVYGAVEVDGEVVADPDTVKGYPSGYNATTITNHPSWTGEYNDYLALNPMLRDIDDPIFFQTYAEVEFMLAEAAARGWNVPGSAASHYEDGVRAAMNYLTLYGSEASISSATIDQYLDQNPYNAGASRAEQLDQINTQYWAAILLNGFEAWANWRRSGYPQLDPAPVDNPEQAAGSYTEGVIMRRFPYPNDEMNLNSENYETARSRQGITDQNMLTVPVWWDCGEAAAQCNTTDLGAQADPDAPSNGPGDGPADM